jgi:hypothetical protein
MFLHWPPVDPRLLVVIVHGSALSPDFVHHDLAILLKKQTSNLSHLSDFVED